MIKIYGMKTCPDCIAVDKHVEGDSRYEVIDIGSHIKYLKEFLRLRDNNVVFDESLSKMNLQQFHAVLMALAANKTKIIKVLVNS